jgi:hypothetical protein
MRDETTLTDMVEIGLAQDAPGGVVGAEEQH